MAISGPLIPQASSRQSVNTRQKQLLRDSVGGLGFMMTAALTQAFAAAVAEADRQVSGQMKALAEVFARVQTDRGARQRIHQRIAELARTSTVQAYGQLVTRQEGPASRTHYRAGTSRFAAGKMLDALQAPGFVEAGPDGINFANTVVLDRIAAQWHRLNFGAAGGRQGARPATFEVLFNSLVVASLGFTEPPSPSFAMPRGFFTTPEGGPVGFGANPAGSDVFTPHAVAGRAARSRYSSRGRPVAGSSRQTAGIAAKNFLDAGLGRMAREIGPAYQDYYRDLFARAKAGKGPIAGRVNVRPRVQASTVNRILSD